MAKKRSDAEYEQAKKEEGRRVHEGEASAERDPEAARRDQRDFKQAARRAKEETAPDARGQAERGRIDQVRTSKGHSR